jgi:hypothetical protein
VKGVTIGVEGEREEEGEGEKKDRIDAGMEEARKFETEGKV